MQLLRGCYVKKSSWQLFYFSSMVCVFVGFVIGEYPKTKLERRHEIPFWVDCEQPIEKVSRTCSLFFNLTLWVSFSIDVTLKSVSMESYIEHFQRKRVRSCCYPAEPTDSSIKNTNKMTFYWDIFQWSEDL